MAVQLAHYFGFGSLVNRQTRPDDERAWNATLHGWQRVWEHRVSASDSRSSCTSLSVEPAQTSIQGVLVEIPLADLAALDAREAGYERMELSAHDVEFPKDVDASTIYLYRSLPENRHLAGKIHPIAQSYVDCVMAGYQERFGTSGLKMMLGTTKGWDRPVLNDRLKPIYPRHVKLSVETLNIFDSLLSEFR